PSTPLGQSCSSSLWTCGCLSAPWHWQPSPASCPPPHPHAAPPHSIRWRPSAMSKHDAEQEVLRLQGLRKSYNVGKPTEVEVLHGLDLRLQRRDFAALIGASGSGKSTLLNVIGLLDRPTAGELYLLSQPTSSMDDAQRTAL